jgi:hypothetical protein
LKYLSGSQNPDEQLLALARRFRQEMASPDFQLVGKHLNRIVIPKKGKVIPERARDGAGLLWLKIFRAYSGDKCILFPFRTASCPRGRVTYNYKNMETHRAMCLMVHKLPPEGKPMALHRCGNGHLGCVNPNHLYWGDQSDNNRDAHRHAKEGKQAA